MTSEERGKIMDRLAKMKALADGGVGGERENAARLLEEVARRYGVDLSSLDDVEVEKRHEFDFKRGWRMDLFRQLVSLARVEQYGSLEVDHLQLYDRKLGRRVVGRFCKCTDAQWVEIMAKYTILARDYEEQLGLFYRAFLEANDLLLECAIPGRRPPTKKEIEDAMKAMQMSVGIKKSQLRKQIEGGQP